MPPQVDFGIIQPVKQLGIGDVYKPPSALEQLKLSQAGLTYEETLRKKAFYASVSARSKSAGQQGVEYKNAKSSLDTNLEGRWKSLVGTEEVEKEKARVQALMPPMLETIIAEEAIKFNFPDVALEMKQEVRKTADSALKLSMALLKDGMIEQARAVLENEAGAIKATYPGMPTTISNEDGRLATAMFQLLDDGKDKEAYNLATTFDAGKKMIEAGFFSDYLKSVSPATKKLAKQKKDIELQYKKKFELFKEEREKAGFDARIEEFELKEQIKQKYPSTSPEERMLSDSVSMTVNSWKQRMRTKEETEAAVMDTFSLLKDIRDRVMGEKKVTKKESNTQASKILMDMMPELYSPTEPTQPQAAPEPEPTPPPTATTREGATATNPKTGERMIFRNGRWEPLAQ